MIAGPRTAYVVFSNETSFFWLRFLKTGFRHCGVILPAGNRPRSWTIIDPLSHHLVIDDVTVPDECPDLPEQLRQTGRILVSVRLTDPPQRPAPIMPLSCVEVTKRLLGIHTRRIWTPYQLYLYLTNPKPRRRQSPWVA